MYNPLNCAIVVNVYLHTSQSGRPVPRTQTQLYTELTLCLVSRYLNAQGDPRADKLPNTLEDLRHHYHDLYQQLRAIGKLAFQGVMNDEVVFKNLPGNMGLLTEHRSLYIRNKTTTFNFFHLTLQEYMSAFFVSQLEEHKHKSLFVEQNTSWPMNVVARFFGGLTKMRTVGWYVFRNKLVEVYT